MKRKILLLFSIVCILLCLVGCNENKNDQIEIFNKNGAIFDNILIPIKDGYFYDRHEKFTVDENIVGVTIYFINDEADEWNNNSSKNN